MVTKVALDTDGVEIKSFDMEKKYISIAENSRENKFFSPHLEYSN